MHDEHDIVARFSSSGASNSVGALAAYLGRSCGHVSLDQRVIAQGYRFHPWLSDEIPHFFNKRLTSGKTNLAVTLQAGFDLDGEDPFDGCSGTSEAREIIASEDRAPTLWLAKATVGVRLLDIAEISDPLFIAKHPDEFRQLADELVAVGVLQTPSCPLCAE